MRVREWSNRLSTAHSRASVKPVYRSESNGSEQRHETTAPGILKNEIAMEWINIIIQGVLIGGLYAMFAAGLALIFGVMRLVNIAHGDLIVLAADSRRLRAGAIEVASFPLMEGVWIGVLPLLQFVVAVVVIGALQVLFYRTAFGRAFRATSDDQSVAQLMGLDNRHVFALAMALSLAIVAVAGVFIAVRTNFDPAIGPARLIFGFEAVIIGGLGSMWGTLAGGIILGVSQAIGAQINPGWQLLAGHLAFLLVLALRPEGLFPKVKG